MLTKMVYRHNCKATVSLRAILDIDFNCCWRFSNNVVSVNLYTSMWFCNASPRRSMKDGPRWDLRFSWPPWYVLPLIWENVCIQTFLGISERVWCQIWDPYLIRDVTRLFKDMIRHSRLMFRFCNSFRCWEKLAPAQHISCLISLSLMLNLLL